MVPSPLPCVKTETIAKAELRVKAALYDRGSMVGAWEVNSWVLGGITGGSEDNLYDSAAQEIAYHLRGDF